MAKSRDFYSGLDPRELPFYSVTEAARYLGLPTATLRSWVAGRSYAVSSGRGFSEPLIPVPEGDGKMSFNNLVEAHVLSALRRKHGASMNAIRVALRYAEKKLSIERLLLRDELRTSAGELFWDQFSSLINLSRSGQIAMREVLGMYLQRIERDTSRLPLRLYPLVPFHQEGRTIVIDPAVSFGKPTVRGISTRIIAQRIDAGEEIKSLADDYDLSEDEIRDALVYEQAA